MKYNPTRKQEILDYIKTYSTGRGFPPTIKEIAAALGVGTSTVSHYLDALETEGRIERRFNAARAIKVL